MSSILFAKLVSFEHSVSSPRPVITSRRKKNKAKVFQHQIDSQSASCSLISRHVLTARAVGALPRCREFLSNRKYRYRSYIQTDDTHCWQRFEEVTRSTVYYLKLGISLWQVICKTNGFSFLKIENDSGQRGPLCLTSILFIIANNSPLSQRTPVYPSAQVHV